MQRQGAELPTFAPLAAASETCVRRPPPVWLALPSKPVSALGPCSPCRLVCAQVPQRLTVTDDGPALLCSRLFPVSPPSARLDGSTSGPALRQTNRPLAKPLLTRPHRPRRPHRPHRGEADKGRPSRGPGHEGCRGCIPRYRANTMLHNLPSIDGADRSPSRPATHARLRHSINTHTLTSARHSLV